MSYPISKNVNPYQYQQQQQEQQPSVAMGVNGVGGVNAPQLQLQNVDPDAVRKNITQNSALKGVANLEEQNKWMTPVLSIPVILGMQYGMEKFNAACGDKNILKKIGDWGEKIGLKVEGKLPIVKKFFDGIEKSKSKFLEKVVPKSNILKAIFQTPAQPEKQAVMMQYKGTRGELAGGASSLLDQYSKQNPGFLKEIGLTEAQLKEITEKSHDHIDEIMEILEKNKDKYVKSEGKGFLNRLAKKNKFLSDLFNRDIKFSEYANKLRAFSNGKQSYLGKKLPRAVIRTLEGITNATSMGSGFMGKIGIFMASFFIADAIKKTIDAPKGEKVATFAENNIYNVGLYLTIPLATALIYKPGGLKYLGFSKEQVEAYRARLGEFNARAKSGQIKDKTVYKAELQRLKADLKNIFKKTANKIEIQKADKPLTKVGKALANIVRKPLSLAGKLFMVGTEQAESFNPKGIKPGFSGLLEKGLPGIFEHFVESMKHRKTQNFKGFVGAVLRFTTFMFAISPFFADIFAKGSHVIFGKPSKSIIDDGKEPEKEQIISPITSNQQTQTVGQPQMPSQVQMPMQPVAQQNPAYSQPQVMQPQTQSQVNVIKPNPAQIAAAAAAQGITRSYIPSPQPVQLDPTRFDEENQRLMAADKKLTAAEKKAQKNVEKK